MRINAHTKISAIIRENPSAIDAIASINKHFEKLRNPILRKLLASRVTIEDAAKIGGSSVEAFFERLRPLGFVAESSEAEKRTEDHQEINPVMEKATKENTVVLDVRAELASGKDPFQTIMQALQLLPAGKTLLLVNTFEPVPLLNILSKKGYEFYVERPASGVVNTYIRLTGAAASPIRPSATEDEVKQQMSDIVKSYEGKMRTIDVRDLEMPLPMVTILQELETLPQDHALYVHHKKIPQFLLPDLQQRGYRFALDEQGEGNVKMIIYR